MAETVITASPCSYICILYALIINCYSLEPKRGNKLSILSMLFLFAELFFKKALTFCNNNSISKTKFVRIEIISQLNTVYTIPAVSKKVGEADSAGKVAFWFGW